MQGTEGLQQLERECAEGRTAPRVSLADIEANIGFVSYFDGFDAAHSAGDVTIPAEYQRTLNTLTICLVVLKNGFTIIGKSAPAHPDNFDPAIGQKLAYDDAVRQCWPLMGYELRQRLYLGGPQADQDEKPAIGGIDGAEPFSGDDYAEDEQR